MRPAISVNKGCWGCHSMSHCSPEETQDGEKQGTGPRELKGMWKEWFQWAQPLATSGWRKRLNSFTWGIWVFFVFFFLINGHLLMFWPPDSCCKNCIFWLLPYFFRAVPLSYMRGCLLGQSPQKVHGIKQNSQFLGCAFFTWQNLEKEER